MPFLASFVSFVIVLSLVPQAWAAPVTLDVHPDCCGRQYTVYGDDQPEGNVTFDPASGHYQGDCTVTVDLNPVDASPEEPSSGLLGSVSGFADSVSAPFQALVEASGVKKALLELASPVYFAHTRVYHAFLDEEIFEPMIELVADFEDSEQWASYLEGLGDECTADNPKPECVAERALCSYEKYVGVLFYQAGQTLLESSPGIDVSNAEIGQLLGVLQQRDQALMEEARHVHEAMETAMLVYQQYYETYRLHLGFRKVIESLVQVRNMTSYMRELVGCVPGKFVGAATTKCN